MASFSDEGVGEGGGKELGREEGPRDPGYDLKVSFVLGFPPEKGNIALGLLEEVRACWRKGGGAGRGEFTVNL